MSTMAEDVTQILWGKRFPRGGRDEYVVIDANMAHAVAEHLADALTKAGYGKLADAWDEGHRTYVEREMDDCRCGAYYEGECGCGKYGTGKIITPNPYRSES